MRCMPSITRPSDPRMTGYERSTSWMSRIWSTMRPHRRDRTECEPVVGVDILDREDGHLHDGQIGTGPDEAVDVPGVETTARRAGSCTAFSFGPHSDSGELVKTGGRAVGGRRNVHGDVTGSDRREVHHVGRARRPPHDLRHRVPPVAVERKWHDVVGRPQRVTGPAGGVWSGSGAPATAGPTGGSPSLTDRGP